MTGKSITNDELKTIAATGDETEREFAEFVLYARQKPEPRSPGAPTAEERASAMAAAEKFFAEIEAAEAEMTSHTSTEIEDVPDGGVSIHVFFRYCGRDFVAHIYHPCGDSGDTGPGQSSSANDPG
jgi:benzoyl-CoA reductase/2-hydroxyglutaryl-CoA dehydratase subunit BcrC/BadD/HgdB